MPHPRFLFLLAFSQTGHCRLQDKTLASTYSGPIDVVRQIVRKDGILGLYAGMEATFWRYVNISCLLRGSTDTAMLPQAFVVERRLLWIHFPSQDDASKGGGLLFTLSGDIQTKI